MPAVKIDATTTLVNWYLGQKPPRYDAAEPLAHTLISLDPHRLVGYRMLATVYTAAARWPELDAMLADAEKAVPDDLGAHYAAARTIIADGNDFPRAERRFRRYLGQEPEVHEPTLAQAHWRLGNVLEKEGRRADAVAELEQAVKLKPDFEEAKKDLARVRASR
jgi:tetratricopeptide (TPR) repeat protein